MRSPPRAVEPWSRIVRLDDAARTPQEVALEPDAAACAALAERLGIVGLRKLRLAGRLLPEGRRDWHLKAHLGATAVQACAVTLAPVTTRIDEPVERRYSADMPDLPPGDEIEMPDETLEPLPAALDLGAVTAEALALALPAWPRAEGAELGRRHYAAPGTRPMTDEDARPFASLARLMRDDGDGG